MSELFPLADLISQEVNSKKEINSLERALMFLESSKKDMSPKNYVELLNEDVNPKLSRNIYFEMENKEVIDNDSVAKNKANRLFECSRILLNRDSEPENQLLATIPQEENLYNSKDFGRLTLELKDIISSAEHRIIIMNPFFSSLALDQIRPALSRAVKNGATIEIITRYLTYKTAENQYNSRFIRNLLEETEIADEITLYEYTDDENTTFHAKMAIADDKAYLGTANLTHKGLGDNLELGIIFRDQTVTKLSKLVEAVKKSDLLHTVKMKEGEFERAY
jgi:phosphatidylserine/phosphatidylglycerophosphate/cardiolipin synthase-like enzyme